MSTYVYRLTVSPPAEPPDEELIEEVFGPYGPRPFRWPPRRNYFTSASAHRRAHALRRLGADVQIEWTRIDSWTPWGEELSNARPACEEER